MAGHSSSSIDVLRKLAIVAVLFGGMILLHRFAVPDAHLDSRGLLALGFVVMAAYVVGELAAVIKLPHITGYLLMGLLLGPSVAELLGDLLPAGLQPLQVPPLDEGILNERVKRQLLLMDSLALGLIALTAGGELKLEALRDGFRQLTGMLVGQGLAVFASVSAFIVLIGSGWIPGLTLGPLAALPLVHVVAVGVVVASVSLATSPPVTIAVMNGVGAKGPMTTTVLSGVILLDVVVVLAYSAMNTLASNLMGLDGAAGLGPALGHIGAAILLGLALGLVIHLYLRHVGAEILLFIVGVIFATTFIAHALHAEVALVFIVAGFVTANFSDIGDHLIHEMERMSMPVYVVFFTLAGAKLHIDVLWAMAPFALGLALVRGGAIYAGVRAGATLSGAGLTTQKYGWMGFVSQAGLAISLASVLPSTFPGELGTSLFSLMLAGIALNEMVGPILLQFGLGLAGETADQRGEEAQVEEGARPKAAVERAPWSAAEDMPDPWGPPLDLQAQRLNDLTSDLEVELQSLVRELGQGPLLGLQSDCEDYLRGLRREFLRFHRRATVRVQNGEPMESMAAFFRSEVGELGERWRDLVLARGAQSGRSEQWSPLSLVDVLDGLANTLPEAEVVPVEAESLIPREDEHVVARTLRAVLRARARLSAPTREVSARALGRYHLSGRAPARLEGLATLLVAADLHLAGRTSTLFDAFALAWERLAEHAEEGCSPEALLEALWTARSDLDDDFNAAFSELEDLATDGTQRAALALGGLVRDMKGDLAVLGTLDLPYWRRRFSRVFKERNRGLEALGGGLTRARSTVQTRYSALALELELVGLEGRVRDVVELHASQFARLVRGRGTTQLERVDAAVSQVMADLEGVVEDGDRQADDLSGALRGQLEPIQRLIGETLRNTRSLADQLSGEAWISPLTEALMTAAGDLTEWYTVPTARAEVGEWSLPPEVPTTEVPFRDVVVSYVEASVTRDLLELTRDLEQKVARLLAALEDMERVVAFNLELACAELDALPPGEAVPDETRDLVREMVVGAVGRSHGRLRKVKEESGAWSGETHDAVVRAVVGELEDLRGQVLDGRVNELRLFLMREAEVRARLVRRAGEWRGLVPLLRDRGQVLFNRALGEERLEAIRVYLGLPEDVARERSVQVALAPPEPDVELPVVYRRLFSDQALEAGDLLTGRHEAVARLREALEAPDRGGLQAVALIGPDDTSVGAVINAVTRAVDVRRVRRITLDGPVTAEEVGTWFDGDADQLNVLVGGLRWLFEARPGGLRPLRRLVDGLVDESSRVRWLIGADQCVWTYAARLAPLDDAVASLVRLQPLEAEELTTAILSRHSMSGYAIEYQGREDLGWQVQNLLLRVRDRESRGQRAWFRTLHDASAGNMHDALRLWMAAVREVDEGDGVIRMGRVPRPPVTRLGRLPDEIHLALLLALRQGWLTAELLGAQLDLDATTARARVATMEHQGLLVPEADRLVVANHLRASVEQVLRARGWAP